MSHLKSSIVLKLLVKYVLYKNEIISDEINDSYVLMSTIFWYNRNIFDEIKWYVGGLKNKIHLLFSIFKDIEYHTYNSNK